GSPPRGGPPPSEADRRAAPATAGESWCRRAWARTVRDLSDRQRRAEPDESGLQASALVDGPVAQIAPVEREQRAGEDVHRGQEPRADPMACQRNGGREAAVHESVPIRTPPRR